MKKINIIIRREIKIYLFNNYLFFILGVASILGIIITSNTSLKVISLLIFCSFFSHSFYYLYNLPKRLKFDKLDLTSDITCAKGDGTWLSNSANLNLFNIMKTFGNVSNFHFVEVVCGKGWVLYLAAAYFNFNKITGIERDLDGIKVCKNNN